MITLNSLEFKDNQTGKKINLYESLSLFNFRHNNKTDYKVSGFIHTGATRYSDTKVGDGLYTGKTEYNQANLLFLGNEEDYPTLHIVGEEIHLNGTSIVDTYEKELVQSNYIYLPEAPTLNAVVEDSKNIPTLKQSDFILLR